MGVSDLLFITYRILPFIMISFLVITSLFMGELSAFLVLVGVLLSSIITVIVSKSDFVKKQMFDTDLLQKCNLISFDGHVLSNLPLSTHIYAFLSAYFIYVTNYHGIIGVMNNAILIGTLLMILVVDMWFNYNNCLKSGIVAIPLLIGGFCGWLWPQIIGRSSHMVPNSKSGGKCKISSDKSNKKFQCMMKRTILS
jgi:hypothetical protein